MISARGSPSTGKPTIQSVQKVLPSHQLGLSIANRVYCNYDRRAEPPFMWPKLQYRQVARESISTSGSSSKGGPSKGGRSHVSVIETNATERALPIGTKVYARYKAKDMPSRTTATLR